MSDFIHINETNFDELVLLSEIPILVEFGAAWCGPCKRMEPELERLAGTLLGKMKIAKMDVDECVGVAMKYQIMSVPTLILFVKGEPCTRMSGYQPRDRILDKIEAYLP